MELLKFVNQGGIPSIIVVGTNTIDTVTTFSFNNHPYRQTNRFYGFFVAKFPNAVTETSTNTVRFNTLGVGGSSIDVYSSTGAALTIADLTSTDQAVHLFFYDKDSNRVQLMV
uniref:Capsid protein n=1 Tax=Geladintestivirus 5 TaxID=3233137 RepID=A0AAU8MH08_9CAUD